jgi:hypothetical protein
MRMIAMGLDLEWSQVLKAMAMDCAVTTIPFQRTKVRYFYGDGDDGERKALP